MRCSASKRDGGTRFRAVTHLDVNEAAVRDAADIIKQEAGQTSRAVKSRVKTTEHTEHADFAAAQ